MKRFILAILVLLILLIAVPAFASNTFVVTIMDMDVSVCMPDDYDTLTRDLDSHIGLLKLYKLDKTALLTTLRNENRYVEAINRKTKNEIMLTSYMDKNSINLWSYSQMKNVKIAQTVASLQRVKDEQTTVSFYESEGGYKFIKYTHGLDEPKAIVYSTVENGRNIEIAAYPYASTFLQQADINALEDVVDDFRLITIFPSRDAPDSVSPFLIVCIGVAIAASVFTIRHSNKKKNQRAQQYWQQQRNRQVTSKRGNGVVYQMLDDNKNIQKTSYGNAVPDERKRRKVGEDTNE